MIKADRVTKLVNANSKILNMLILAYEDNYLENSNNEEFYKELKEAYKNNLQIEEELTY